MNKIKLLLVTTLFTFTLSLAAQEAEEDVMTVKEFYMDLKDISAARSERTDLNGNPAALVKVQVLTEDEVTISSAMKLGDVEHKANEYWIYMAAGAKNMKISHPLFPMITVVFSEVSGGEVVKLEGKTTYRLVIDVPRSGAESFDDILNDARKMRSEMGTHPETEYYRKAALRYDAAMKHQDCPATRLQELQVEYDEMRYYRKFTNMYNLAEEGIQRCTQNYGYDSDSVYIFLKRKYATANKLVEKNPTAAFQQLKQTSWDNLQKHPKSKTGEVSSVNVQRRQVKGFVERSWGPTELTGIYAAKVDNSDKKDRKYIGQVAKDGSYSVVMPDGYNYIVFDFDFKNKSTQKETHHLITESTTLDVKLSR